MGTGSVSPSLQCPDSMARYFKETDIDEFRECFYLYARSGQISTMDELTVIMRSLGMSPTITELKSYMRDKKGKLSFADFLEIMHNHSKKERIPKELGGVPRNGSRKARIHSCQGSLAYSCQVGRKAKH